MKNKFENILNNYFFYCNLTSHFAVILINLAITAEDFNNT